MIEPIGTDGELFDIAAIQSAIQEGLDKSAENAKSDFESHQSTWSDKSRSTPQIIRIPNGRTVQVTGRIFRKVDHGRKARTIVPKRKKALRFRPNYTRKTTPKKIPAKSGGASGDYVFAKQVEQPATKPSLISESVYQESQKRIGETMQQCLDNSGAI